jgi:O-antigen/teichoic acid export membrane protein
MIPPEPRVAWHEEHQVRTVALNVGGRYATIAVELVLGLVMLPLNLHYLGQSDYGLWMLAASIVAYFPVMELGYGWAMDRFVAHYRALRNAHAINEIASTLVFVYAAIGLTGFAVVAVIAWHFGAWFDLTPTQARTGGIVPLLVAAQFALGLPFAIFGAVVNGFQRTTEQRRRHDRRPGCRSC